MSSTNVKVQCSVSAESENPPVPPETAVTSVSNLDQFGEVLLTNNGEPVVTEFTAEWCPDCQRAAPVFEQIAEDNQDYASFLQACCSTERGQPCDYSPVCSQFGVCSYPQFKVLLRTTDVSSAADTINNVISASDKPQDVFVTKINTESDFRAFIQVVGTRSPLFVSFIYGDGDNWKAEFNAFTKLAEDNYGKAAFGAVRVLPEDAGPRYAGRMIAKSIGLPTDRSSMLSIAQHAGFDGYPGEEQELRDFVESLINPAK